MFCVLFTAGSFSSISNLPTHSLDREHRYRCREEKVHLVPLYLVTDWHGMKLLKTGILFKKPKSQVFSPFLSVLFYIYIQSPQILAGLPIKQYFGCTLLCFTQKLITAEQRVAAMLIVTVQFHPLPRLTTRALHRECKQKSFPYRFCSLIFSSLMELAVLEGWDTSEISVVGW